MKRAKILAGVAAILAVAGCKTTSGGNSEVDALNNFQQSEKGVICKAEASPAYAERFDTYYAQGSIEIADKANYKERLKSVLAAVPSGFQEWYFLKGGELRYISNAKQFCETRRDSVVDIINHKGEVAGCVHFETVDNSVGMPKIYVGVTSTEYYANLAELSNAIQGFSIVLASYLTEIGPSNNGQPDGSGNMIYEFGKNDQSMKDDKLSLSFLFLDDLIEAQKKDASLRIPDVYMSMIEDKSILDKNVSRDDRWKKVYAVRNTDSYKAFMNMILAQTFDSAHCSDETRALMIGENPVFGQTGRWYKGKMEQELYASIAKAGSEEPVDASAVSTPASVNASAMALTAPDVAKAGATAALVGYRFPILRAIVRAPFVVARYFAQNRPVRTWFATHRPIRRLGAAIFGGPIGRSRVLFPGNRCWRIRRWLC